MLSPGTPDQLRDIVRQIRDILALDTDEQWTPETIEQVAWVLVHYGEDREGDDETSTCRVVRKTLDKGQRPKSGDATHRASRVHLSVPISSA